MRRLFPHRPLSRIYRVLTLALVLAAFPAVWPSPACANDLAALQTSVISTDLFLSWIPGQSSDLALSPEQVSALKAVQGNFKGRSEEIGRRIQRSAEILSQEVGKYPIDLKAIKPAIDEISELRGELTYSAIKSLSHVQNILRRTQWDRAKGEWAHILAAKAFSPGAAPGPGR